MSFRDLERGDQFIADYNKYKAWKALDSEARQTKYESLNVNRFTYNKRDIYVAPFGFSGKTGFVTARGPDEQANQPAPVLRTILAGFFTATRPTGSTDTIVSIGSFPVGKLAKLTLKRRESTATTKESSRITGRKYFRHNTNSVSQAFGKDAADDDLEAAVKKIKAKAEYGTFKAVKGNAIIITPEKVL